MSDRLIYNYVKVHLNFKLNVDLLLFPLKAHAVLAKVGYPEFILNDTYLNEDLKQVCITLILIRCFSMDVAAVFDLSKSLSPILGLLFEKFSCVF